MTIIKLTAEHMKVKQENALDLFYSGIKAKATKDRWARILSRFLEVNYSNTAYTLFLISIIRLFDKF